MIRATRSALLLLVAVAACSRGSHESRDASSASPLPSIGPRPAPEADSLLHIRQLDVGQGDAALITTPEGKHVLIDGGPDARPVADLLRAAGVDTIDLVIASHNHADHIDGLPAVFASTVVRAYIENGIPATTNTYGRLLDAVAHEPGIRVLAASARTITVGSVTLRVLPPSRLDASQNDNSLGVLLEFGSFRALWTGDSERAALGAWLAGGQVPRVAVLKAAHHGSSNGVTAAWVKATQPEVVLVSAGARNTYHHPSAAAIKRWTSAGARVYRTDRDGEIDIDADRGGQYTVRTAAPAAPEPAPAPAPAVSTRTRVPARPRRGTR